VDMVCRASGSSLCSRADGIVTLADLATVDRMVRNWHRILRLLRRSS
jgi:hypothetical protein